MISVLILLFAMTEFAKDAVTTVTHFTTTRSALFPHLLYPGANKLPDQSNKTPIPTELPPPHSDTRIVKNIRNGGSLSGHGPRGINPRDEPAKPPSKPPKKKPRQTHPGANDYGTANPPTRPRAGDTDPAPSDHQPFARFV